MACGLLIGAISVLPEEAEVPIEFVRAAILAVSFEIRADAAREFSCRLRPTASTALTRVREPRRPGEPISFYASAGTPDHPAPGEPALPHAEKTSDLLLDALSKREMEVAALVSAGRTNQQIAHALGLSQKTVETYLARIFRKLGICSRSQIATLIGRARADSA
jgi:DNA-binding NarL/FixJ family response regulator